MKNNYIVIGDSITYGIGDYENGGWSAMLKKYIVNQDDTKIPAVRAKDIAERLNLETDSPYYGYIKFPGNKRGTKGVDLSTVVNSLSLKLGKNSLIERYNIANLENQYAVFKNYIN